MDFDQQCVDALARLKPAWNVTSVTDITILDGGYSNRNYRLSHGGVRYVLRVVTTPESPLAINRAQELALLQSGVAAPPLEAFVLPEGHMLTVHVDGPLLVEADPSPAQLADYLAHLHDVLPPLTCSYDLAGVVTGYFRVAQAHGVHIDPRAVHMLDGLIPTAAARVACHNDLNPWNVITATPDPRSWCTLDWEFAGNNDPLFDLLALGEGLESPAAAERQLIDGYYALRAQEPPPDEAVDSTRAAFLLREYAWALYQESQGNHRAEVVEQREKSLRRLLTLTRGRL